MASRVRSIVSRANKRLTIQSAAFLLASATLVSSLLGLYRDRLLNGMYYQDYKVGIDAYTAAFTIPDFMFFILVSGALSVTFIPVFNQRLATGNKQSAWQLSSSLINFLALITLVASVLIMIFADRLIWLVAPGLNETGTHLAISMMRVIAVNPFLFAIATVIASMQQAIGRYTFFALAPTIYNIGIIIGALYFTNGINLFGWQVFEGGIMGVALGVVLGSAMQLVVSAVGLAGLGFDYRFKIYRRNKGFRRVLRLLPARSLDQSMDYVVGLVEMNLASRMAEGTMRAYQQVSSLHMMPINLIGMAISTAAFPSMTEHLGRGQIDKFRSELQMIIRVIIWLALPVATVTFFARAYVVSFIHNDGDALMAGLLGVLAVAILFRSIYHIASRAFYAQQDTKTPLYISIFSIGLNIVLAIWLSLSLGMGPYGLAFAQSVVAFIEVIILFVIIHRRLPGGLFDRTLLGAIVRMFSITGFTAIVAYIMVKLLDFQSTDLSIVTTAPKFAAITLVSFAAYVALSKLANLREAEPILKRLNSIVFGRVKQ